MAEVSWDAVVGDVISVRRDKNVANNSFWIAS